MADSAPPTPAPSAAEAAPEDGPLAGAPALPPPAAEATPPAGPGEAGAPPADAAGAEPSQSTEPAAKSRRAKSAAAAAEEAGLGSPDAPPRKRTRATAEAMPEEGKPSAPLECHRLVAVLLEDHRRRRGVWAVGQVLACHGEECELYYPLPMTLERTSLGRQPSNPALRKPRTAGRKGPEPPKGELSDAGAKAAEAGGASAAAGEEPTTAASASPVEEPAKAAEWNGTPEDKGAAAKEPPAETPTDAPPLEEAPEEDWYPIRSLPVGLLLALYHQGAALSTAFIAKPSAVKDSAVRRAAPRHLQCLLQVLQMYVSPDSDRNRETLKLVQEALELLQATKRPDGVDLLSPKGRAVWLPVERLVRQIYAAHGLPIAVPGAFDEEEEADPQPEAATSTPHKAAPPSAAASPATLPAAPSPSPRQRRRPEPTTPSSTPRRTRAADATPSPAAPRAFAFTPTPAPAAAAATPAPEGRGGRPRPARASVSPLPPASPSPLQPPAGEDPLRQPENLRAVLMRLLVSCHFVLSPYQSCTLAAPQHERLLESLEMLQHTANLLGAHVPPRAMQHELWRQRLTQAREALRPALTPAVRQDRGRLLRAVAALRAPLEGLVGVVEGAVADDAGHSQRTKCIPDKLATHLKTLYEAATGASGRGSVPTALPPDFLDHLLRHGLEIRDALLTALWSWHAWLPPYAVDLSAFFTLLELLLLNGFLPRDTAFCKDPAVPRAALPPLRALHDAVQTLRLRHPALFPTADLALSKRRADPSPRKRSRGDGEDDAKGSPKRPALRRPPSAAPSSPQRAGSAPPEGPEASPPPGATSPPDAGPPPLLDGPSPASTPPPAPEEAAQAETQPAEPPVPEAVVPDPDPEPTSAASGPATGDRRLPPLPPCPPPPSFE